MLNLERNLVFFDVESTGLHVIRDRIIQIAMIRFTPSGNTDELVKLINPGIPISPEALKIHGFSEEILLHQPRFSEVAQEIYDFIRDADLAGYNSNRFDVPILMEEMARCNLDLEVEKRRLIDVQRIFYRMEPRTLKAAYRFYCSRDLENAHDALADIRATVDVLQGMLERYRDTDLTDEEGNVITRPVSNNVSQLHEFTNDIKVIDATQRLKYNEQGVVVFAFGKYIGQPVAKTLYEDRNYYHWIQEKEFSFQVKKLVRELLQNYEEEIKKNRNT
ncbi:MAG: 3'-5' exonuclease [Saprospiraceae bacterium]